MINGKEKTARKRAVTQPPTIIQLIFPPDQMPLPSLKECALIIAFVFGCFALVHVMAWLYMYVFGGFA